jgi:hypothetical protein
MFILATMTDSEISRLTLVHLLTGLQGIYNKTQTNETAIQFQSEGNVYWCKLFSYFRTLLWVIRSTGGPTSWHTIFISTSHNMKSNTLNISRYDHDLSRNTKLNYERRFTFFTVSSVIAVSWRGSYSVLTFILQTSSTNHMGHKKIKHCIKVSYVVHQPRTKFLTFTSTKQF